MKLATAAALLALPASASAGLWGSSASADAATKPNEPRSLQEIAGSFVPLACNSALDSASCGAWTFGDAPASQVVIPCGTCVDMSTAPATVNAAAGINVEGRMHFPAGSATHISTPHLFVQGKLSMDMAAGAIGAAPDVKITMTGDSDQTLYPESTNAALCPSGCNVGPKAVVVAGGQLDIDAIGDTCPTWSFVQDYIDEGTPNPTSGFPVAPTLDGACTSTLLSANFESGLDKWWGNLGAPYALSTANAHDGNYLQVSRRTDTWQGPYRELARSSELSCLQPNVVYIFSAKIRLDPSADHPTHQSACSATGTNCPALRMQYMKPDDYVVWQDLVVTDRAPADGTWYEISGSFVTQLDWTDQNNVFATFTINGPEKEIDISVDDFLVETAPASLYPDPANVCSNLVTNGDAEAGVAFPFRNYIPSKPLMVVDDGSNSGNKAFYVPEREKQYHSLAFEVVPGCLVSGSAYTFSAKIRVDAAGDVVPKLQFKAEKAGVNPAFNTAGSCPKTGNGRGFVTCTITVTFDDSHNNADRVTGFLNLISVDTDWTADAYFDDLSFTFSAGVDSGGIVLDNGVTDQCYSAGAQAVIPSDDLDYARSQLVTLASASAGLVNVDENTVRIPTTADRSADAAGQFAFLSRKVVFEGDGGYLTILKTPNVAQKINGVGLVGFGQEGVDGRNPIAFIGSDGASTVSKNAISSSKNRCVNVDGQTSNVLVKENVAYDTLGHCYSVMGAGNTFDANLGAVTKKASVGGMDATDTATYYIGSVANTFTNNVAGGSQSSGFLIDTADTGTLTGFSGNVAHSNLIAGVDTAETGYNPIAAATLTGTKAFRNTGPGIRLRSSSNINLSGGYAADNRDGVLVWKGQSITVGGMTIKGQTPVYRDLLVVPGTPRLCTGLDDGPDVGGVRVHPNGGAGPVLVDGVSFFDFGTSSGCQSASGGGTSAIAVVDDDPNLDLSFVSTIQTTGLAFPDGFGPRDEVNLCSATERGIYGVKVDDLDGTLDPNSAAASGYVISEGMTCTSGLVDRVGACSSYCASPGTVGEATAPAPAPETGGAPAESTGSATTCLGATDSTFSNGLGGWRPGPSELWSQLAITSPGKDGGSAARSSIRRSPSMSGMWHDLDPNCWVWGEWYEITADIRFIDNVTLADHSCDPYNMWYGSPESCPFATLVLNRNPLDRIEAAGVVGPLNTVPDTQGVVWQKMYGAFKATNDIVNAGLFPLMFSSAPDNIDLIVDNVVITEVTDVAASVGAVNCDSPVVNGDFETGDLTGWYARGNSNGGDLSPVSGVGGMGTAVRHDGARTQRWHGILQLIPHECFTEGSVFEITAKFKIYDKSGNPVPCNKADPLADDSCPTFELSPNGDINWPQRELPLTNTDTTAMITGEWNVIKNTKTINAAHANFDTRTTWFTINSVEPIYDYEIDDIVMTKIA